MSAHRPCDPSANEPTPAKPPPQSQPLTCSLAPSSSEPSSRVVTILLNCAWARLLTEFWILAAVIAFSGLGTGLDIRYQSSLLGFSAKAYWNPPAVTGVASLKAVVDVVPPLVTTTTGMPEPVVAAPALLALAFLIVSAVVPVAVPPLMMI